MLKNCKQDFPQSRWRVLGFSENHEDETTLKWTQTFCNCVCLATNLSLSWIHRESVRNEMLDTNESGLRALALSRKVETLVEAVCYVFKVRQFQFLYDYLVILILSLG